jgi:hypothetical protein
MLYDPKWNKIDAASRVLLSAADYMDKHGWCGAGARGPNKETCPVIAIIDVLLANYFSTTSNWDLDSKIRDAVINRFARHLGRSRSRGIIEWNENVCRSKEECVAALRGAALYK